jgi:hypothetical protein
LYVTVVRIWFYNHSPYVKQLGRTAFDGNRRFAFARLLI